MALSAKLMEVQSQAKKGIEDFNQTFLENNDKLEAKMTEVLDSMDINEICQNKPDLSIPEEERPEPKPLPFTNFVEFQRFLYIVPQQNLDTVVFHQKQKNHEIETTQKKHFQSLAEKITSNVTQLDENVKRIEAEIKSKILDYDQEVEGKINKVNENIDELQKAIETDVKGEAEKTKEKLEREAQSNLENIEKL